MGTRGSATGSVCPATSRGGWLPGRAPGLAGGPGDHDSLQRTDLIGKGWLYAAGTRAALQVTITGKRAVA
jgi:hypothetical protein